MDGKNRIGCTACGEVFGWTHAHSVVPVSDKADVEIELWDRGDFAGVLLDLQDDGPLVVRCGGCEEGARISHPRPEAEEKR